MSKDPEEVIDAVEALRQAMLDADGVKLQELTAEKLSYGHTSGVIEDKEAFISAIVGPNNRDDFKTITQSDVVVTVSGDTALVRYRFQAEVHVNGEPMFPDIRVLQVWQLQSNVWKLLARQAYRVNV